MANVRIERLAILDPNRPAGLAMMVDGGVVMIRAVDEQGQACIIQLDPSECDELGVGAIKAGHAAASFRAANASKIQNGAVAHQGRNGSPPSVHDILGASRNGGSAPRT